MDSKIKIPPLNEAKDYARWILVVRLWLRTKGIQWMEYGPPAGKVYPPPTNVGEMEEEYATRLEGEFPGRPTAVLATLASSVGNDFLQLVAEAEWPWELLKTVQDQYQPPVRGRCMALLNQLHTLRQQAREDNTLEILNAALATIRESEVGCTSRYLYSHFTCLLCNICAVYHESNSCWTARPTGCGK